ncbi:hypothetical protein A3A54_00950 [Candidatus Curtissbacteria bacterium RIFCSPLOWO2_01_FULL_39_62]|uniref:DUF4399 domain-containing protein n=2 Tax=Candidatus Curtissiibacteriota TaxID=1752717 RepID=A0A1F5G8E4_9BACT|nr:MAG: hypothetical protein A3D04_01575 [Candidatus Curtissbacteria bacterium RIFCSPHIGHO2_02_FULL_40_16b]OGD90090.1 MAG: hypothetical protein A3E11_01580 [Candidatus Curtissbacteria bacterium RIFCSPHIGHO2_12_FULL_38_37]OGE00501.1 MAG: hypothetical protein A3J17_05040 [Candidatus Curtissbacteria bacterium RIFCSPLOWO2_02_FULL_40_11]OGE00527.1 MAG: hypothetical protein A3A54_00950 [Candidatus Curtissbacteria bacterium RIFCSPLOWO2_01_FULL_39_62]OGE13225.1 MAG: hypothetical protein A3G14_00425 [Ca
MIKKIQTFILSLIAVFVATAAVNAQATGAPTLEIITPGEDQIIYGNTIPILFNVENFEIVNYEENTKPTAGQGHIHIWLDDENPTPVSANKVVENTFTFSDVPYGQHTLMAELVGNTHQSLTPPQKMTVNFTNAEIASSEAAATSGFDKNTALVILVVVALVIIAAWWYTKEEDEEEISETKPKRTKKAIAKKTTRKKTK